MINITACDAKRLALQAGSTTLTLDKTAGTAVVQRKLLFWPLKASEMPLSDVQDVAIGSVVDAASGVEMCHTKIVTRPGAVLLLPAADKSEAEKTALTVRDFLGLAA